MMDRDDVYRQLHTFPIASENYMLYLYIHYMYVAKYVLISVLSMFVKVTA